jgi:hypothetical protein
MTKGSAAMSSSGPLSPLPASRLTTNRGVGAVAVERVATSPAMSYFPSRGRGTLVWVSRQDTRGDVQRGGVVRAARWTPLRVQFPQPPLERCEADRVELADRSLVHALDAKALCMGNELGEHHTPRECRKGTPGPRDG